MLTLTKCKQLIKDNDRDLLEEMLKKYDEDVVEAAYGCDIPLDSIEDTYAGNFDSDEDFAQNMAEETGAVDKNLAWPNNCIDWEQAAKELMYDYVEDNGHYFRNC